MKTPARSDHSVSGSPDHDRRTSRPWRLPSLLAAILVMGNLAQGGGVAGAAADFCRRTTAQAFQSCQAGSRSDKLLAGGICANFADATASKTCNQQAVADAKEAQQGCADQHRARKAVCERLGPAAYDPPIVPASFVATIDNPYFPLTPGTTFIYEGQTPAGFEHVEFAVTHHTKQILGVTCVEVHDTATVDGTLEEDTLDWFAQDTDGNVWYFGENTHQLAGGLIVGLEGTWTAGVDGARPGIVMPAHPAIGAFYRQEFLLGTAEDMAEVSSLTASATVPAGTYDPCLKTTETSPLEPDILEEKFYFAGVGNVLTVDLVTGERSELVSITTGN